MAFCLFIGTSAFAVEYGEELNNMPERTYEQIFSDVSTSHWAFEYISELVNDNVLSGYHDGLFRPNDNVTRAEFAKIMTGASGIQVKPATSTSFEDVAVTDSRAYMPMDSIGIKDDCYYYWYNDEFKKISVSSGKVSKLEINTLSNNVEFDDMGALAGISERMIVVDDDTFIFYDHTMQAFRKLEKNN